MFWNRKKSKEIPDNGHCWHRVKRYGPCDITHWKVDRCCYCDLVWNPDNEWGAMEGHGKFAPEEIPKIKPTGKCPGR